MDSGRVELGAVLRRAYDIVPVSIGDAPRGFVAETFDVRAGDGQRYFAKLLPLWADAAAVLGGLPVLEELHTLGIDTVSRPVRTCTGELSVTLDGRTLVVFAFVEGRGGRSVAHAFAPYVALLARIHQATTRVQTTVPREQFHLPWAATFERVFPQVVREPLVTAPQAATQRLLHRYQEQIERDWATLLALAQSCRAAVWTPQLTHGDALGDNVIAGDDGRLYLIDWDGLLLAPAERDAWFFLHEAGLSTAAFLGHDAAEVMAFLPLYQQVFPAYRPDPLRYRFYLFMRFFQDLLDYLVNIVDSPSVEQQQFNLGELEQTCFGWLWPAMRRAGVA